MTPSALFAAAPAAISVTAAHAAPSSQPSSAPLTRVSLAYIEPRFKLYLRFGEPARTLRLDRWRRCAVFLPRNVLPRALGSKRLRHDPLAAHGDASRHAAGRHAAHPRRAARRTPAAARRRRNAVRAVLERIDGIEGQGIAAIDVSPAYWRTLGNRLAARPALPEYTAERHAARLAGKALP